MTSRAIGFGGVSRISGNDRLAATITFALAAMAVKSVTLDPNKTYGLFMMGAGPADIVVKTTSDAPEAIANGTAKYAATKTYTAAAAAGGYLASVNGVTGVQVTHTKSGAGVDDAPTVAKLGGRYQFRAVEGVVDGDGGLGAYTALTAT